MTFNPFGRPPKPDPALGNIKNVPNTSAQLEAPPTS